MNFLLAPLWTGSPLPRRSGPGPSAFACRWTASAARRRAAGGLLLASALLCIALRPLSRGLAANQDASWSPPAALSGSGPGALGPRLAGAASQPSWAAWEEDGEILTARFDATAGAWSPPARAAAGQDPDLALGADGRPHLVFVGEFEGRYDIFYSQREARGWSLPRNVSGTLGISATPAIALSGEQRFVAWSEAGRLYLARSTDGARWSMAPILINQSQARGRHPRLLAGQDGSLEMAWQGETSSGKPDIRYALWREGRWSLGEFLSTEGLASEWPALVSEASGTRVLTWRASGQDLEGVVGTPGLWDWPAKLVEAADLSAAPALAARADGPGAEVAWRDGQARLRYAALGEGGWTESEALGDSTAGAPALGPSTDGGTLLLWPGGEGRQAVGLRYRLRAPQAVPPPSMTPTAETTIEPPLTGTPETPVPPTATASDPVPSPGGTASATPGTEPTASGTPATSEPSATPGPSASPAASATLPATSTALPGPGTGSPPPHPTASEGRIYLPFAWQRRDAAARGGRAVGTGRQPGFAEWPAAAEAASASKDRSAEPPAGSWSAVTTLAERPQSLWAPDLAIEASGRWHLVWEEDGQVFHMLRDAAGWQPARRLAAGESPALALAADGALHLLLANRFDGQQDIFHLRWTGDGWSLPVKLSRSEGHATAPTLRAASSGPGLFAAWVELRAAGPIVYIGRWDGRVWHAQPQLSARGQGPSLLPPDGEADSLEGLRLAWHQRPAPNEPYALYLAARDGDGWSLSERVSDAEGRDATAASLAGRPEGLDLAWQEGPAGATDIAYSRRAGEGWQAVARLATGGGREPQMLSDRAGRGLIWSAADGLAAATELSAGAWQVSPLARGEGPRGAAGLRDAEGHLQVIWAEAGPDGGGRLLQASRRDARPAQLWLPMLLLGR